MSKRKRDYAAERARRDERARAAGYASYNAQDYDRRKKKAEQYGFSTPYRMERWIRKLTHQLAEGMPDVDSLDELLDQPDDWWRLFRNVYGKLAD